MSSTPSFRQFVFGKTIVGSEPLSKHEIEDLVMRAKKNMESRVPPTQAQILALFSRLSRSWADKHYGRRMEALDALVRNSGLDRRFVEAIFDEFPKFISPEAIIKKLEGEFGNAFIQEEAVLQPSTGSRLIAQPAGLVLHVASGNVFMAGVESLVDGIITKNINFLKLSSADRDFLIIFAESIKEHDEDNVFSPHLAVLWWAAGDTDIEGIFKQEMDRIVFWGGYDALRSWKKGLGRATILIQHGPKISFGVISKEGLANADFADLADRIALDVAMWDQKACNCPQMIFVDLAISDAQIKQFLYEMSESFKRINDQFPCGRRSGDEYVEILKTRELALAKGLIKNESIEIIGPETFDWTIILEGNLGSYETEFSPLNRTILIKRYNSLESLCGSLKERAFYLQTVGYCLGSSEINEYAAKLSRAGVSRICPFGVMPFPAPGSPHDGSYALRDLVRFTVVEQFF